MGAIHVIDIMKQTNLYHEWTSGLAGEKPTQERKHPKKPLIKTY